MESLRFTNFKPNIRAGTPPSNNDILIKAENAKKRHIESDDETCNKILKLEQGLPTEEPSKDIGEGQKLGDTNEKKVLSSNETSELTTQHEDLTHDILAASFQLQAPAEPFQSNSLFNEFQNQYSSSSRQINRQRQEQESTLASSSQPIPIVSSKTSCDKVYQTIKTLLNGYLVANPATDRLNAKTITWKDARSYFKSYHFSRFKEYLAMKGVLGDEALINEAFEDWYRARSIRLKNDTYSPPVAPQVANLSPTTISYTTNSLPSHLSTIGQEKSAPSTTFETVRTSLIAYLKTIPASDPLFKGTIKFTKAHTLFKSHHFSRFKEHLVAERVQTDDGLIDRAFKAWYTERPVIQTHGRNSSIHNIKPSIISCNNSSPTMPRKTVSAARISPVSQSDIDLVTAFQKINTAFNDYLETVPVTDQLFTELTNWNDAYEYFQSHHLEKFKRYFTLQSIESEDALINKAFKNWYKGQAPMRINRDIDSTSKNANAPSQDIFLQQKQTFATDQQSITKAIGTYLNNIPTTTELLKLLNGGIDLDESIAYFQSSHFTKFKEYLATQGIQGNDTVITEAFKIWHNTRKSSKSRNKASTTRDTNPSASSYDTNTISHQSNPQSDLLKAVALQTIKTALNAYCKTIPSTDPLLNGAIKWSEVEGHIKPFHFERFKEFLSVQGCTGDDDMIHKAFKMLHTTKHNTWRRKQKEKEWS